MKDSINSYVPRQPVTNNGQQPDICWTEPLVSRFDTGLDEWKNEEKSDLYDYQLIKDRLKILRTIRKNGDIVAMVFNLRTSLSRDLANIGNERVTSI